MELHEQVIKWAKDKNINDPVKQTLKTLAEAGELADAVCKSNLEEVWLVNNERRFIENLDEIVDSIGDIEVCLTILKNQLGLHQNEPLQYAWDEIKDRKGKTINGTFIKE